VRLRTEVRPAGSVWVGQRRTLYVDLMTTSWFSGTPRFDLPELPDVLVMKVGSRAVVSSEQVDGVEYTVQRHEFAIYAQRAGERVIPPFEIRFSVSAGIGAAATDHRLTTSEMRVDARMPPGAEQLSSIVSARSLNVAESWQPQPGEAKVGDAFTRTVTLRAADVPGMVFPALPVSEVDGLAAYAKPAGVRDLQERGDFTGERVETVTYVCERDGTFTLPALVIPWWNVADEKLERIELAAVTFEVAANPLWSEAAVAASPVTAGLLRWAGVIFVLHVIGFFVSWKYRKPVTAWWLAHRARRLDSEAASFARLQRACRKGDARVALNTLMRWLEKINAGSETATIAGFLRDHPDRGLAGELAALQSAAVEGKTDWSGSGLLGALRRQRAGRRRASNSASRAVLPDLNP
jgi:hypothetical protein